MAVDNETIPSQLRKGVVELAILALVRRHEAYGAEIVDRLGAYPGLAITAGTAYPLLSRLKKSGLITSVWRESPVGPPRKYYRLSAEGEGAFGGLTQAWEDMKDAMDSLLPLVERTIDLKTERLPNPAAPPETFQ
ncbi:PadR family transcriptional regulator PadR [Cryobacterium sp. MP_M5]|uniref:PadR family transcriptional regulator n=1 Tax=unclassified Cryobacterium TaxID=2649013 RepID=UPI0018CAAA24|nr:MULTISPECIES: PadR family transcriptional regulator [unclassified Cryobacterium]MBG6060053.1 PadR family transcriptional regulator PadR [Cryobacterium sp. MP_M3]MEC5178469.1 PadR family transcriptional regulator PadR [Cryobacterium sp. MP_M5]